ncbi:MAG: DUF192 domain-containing protein [Candidatus Omnitrophica bacterium]|nr:DUF192 domain-containing protein [Candidatus Omnitrophota bacterium]
MTSLHNLTNGAVLATRARVASGLVERVVGLLGRALLPDGEALVIPHCRSIHTWFMRFPIDVVFVSAGMVTKVVQALPPWRFSSCRDSDTVIELPAGTLSTTFTRPGHHLSTEES